MCGIVGYVGSRAVGVQVALDGLKRLEYRGYDSAGLAVAPGDGRPIELRRAVGKLKNLEARVREQPLSGSTVIGHTRWATHGLPSERNAHPHLSYDGRYVVAHNGIVENYRELRQELITAERVEFQSETDSEVIAHLVAVYARQGADFVEAVRRACARLQGAQAFAVLSRDAADQLVAVRIGNAGGIVLGVGRDEMFVASDVPALVEQTRDVVFLESCQIARLGRNGFEVQTLDGRAVQTVVHTIAWDAGSAGRGQYQHFMLKEIFEQPQAITNTLRGRVDFETGQVSLADLPLSVKRARQLKRLVSLGCGTSAYSGLVGEFQIETLARLPVEVEIGSEFRYRNPVLDAGCTALAITQSGETVDTLAGMEEVRDKGGQLWSIVNATGSQAMRMADGCIAMRAGPEIGVASTKAFTTSVVDQYLLGLYLGRRRGVLSAEASQCYARDVAQLAGLLVQALDRAAEVEQVAQQVAHYENFLFLGRGVNYPIALEGALKLKEVSYLHAEGYAAGELKHGPIALLSRQMPVVAIAVQDRWYTKMISQIEQVKARPNSVVIAVATEGDEFIRTKADLVLYVPRAPELLEPVVTVIPLQLLAYYVAALRGCDVDQPHHLAKSVTVE